MYKETFPKRIKKVREDAGYTQQQVQDETGIKRAKLSRMETGLLEPNLEDLGLLAQFYNADINWLLGVSITPTAKPEPRKQTNQATQTRANT